MRTDAPLNFRYQDILTSIVRAYIDTGEPVGSRTISKRRHNTLSPASIRNVMADLAEEGYLSQPHTSAGRVPTEKAFRFYVGSLVAARPAPAEAERLHHEFSALPTVAAAFWLAPAAAGLSVNAVPQRNPDTAAGISSFAPASAWPAAIAEPRRRPESVPRRWGECTPHWNQSLFRGSRAWPKYTIEPSNRRSGGRSRLQLAA